MGSPLWLQFGRDPADVVELTRRWADVLEEFETSEEAMSRFRDTSEVTDLNRRAGSGAICRPSIRLRRALAAADRAYRMSSGRFDPRILGDLDRLGYRGAPLGGPEAPEHAGEPRWGDAPIVHRLGRGQLSIARPIDLGGIGKGLALRWASDRLERRGATDFLLEAGGDIVARGRDPEGDIWQIGIEDPTGGDDLAVVVLADGAVATSSIQVNRWLAAGRVMHHLVDPRTGDPADGGLLAVTVAGPDPAWAEVWSKTLFVGGGEAIADEARSRGLAAWWVTEDERFEMTAAARAATIWVASEAA